MRVEANEQVFQSVYIDPIADEWQNKIVFHKEIYEHETPGVIALKSLRLEDKYGLVLAAPSSTLKEFRKYFEELDEDEHIGRLSPAQILDVLIAEAESFGITITYVQKGDRVEARLYDVSHLWKAIEPFKDQLVLIRSKDRGRDGNISLVFDNNDEFWIIDEGVPIWRSQDFHVKDTIKAWKDRTGESLSQDFLKERSMLDLPKYEWAQGFVGHQFMNLAQGFFDPLTKRRIVQKGAHYFDPNLPTVEDTEELLKQRQQKEADLKYQVPIDTTPEGEMGDLSQIHLHQWYKKHPAGVLGPSIPPVWSSVKKNVDQASLEVIKSFSRRGIMGRLTLHKVYEHNEKIYISFKKKIKSSTIKDEVVNRRIVGASISYIRDDSTIYITAEIDKFATIGNIYNLAYRYSKLGY